MKKNSNVDEWCFQYERARSDYLRYTKKVEFLFSDLLQTRGIGYHLIESRTKDVASFREKIVRASKSYSNPLGELTDLSGIRIITYYQSDAVLVGNLINSEFDIDANNSIEHSPSGAEFGYRSAHYVVRISKARSELSEWVGLADFRFEIQVRTVLQHAWAAISHKLQYKREDDVPEQLRRKLFRLSALFEIADDEFISLRDTSVKLSEEIDGKLSLGSNGIKIDSVSLSHFLDKSDVVSELCAFAANAGFRFDTPQETAISDDETVSDLIQLTSSVGIQDISQFDLELRAGLSWSKDYFRKIYAISKTSEEYSWYSSSAFTCALVLVGAHTSEIGFDDLIGIGWSEDVASRVLEVAVNF